MRSARAPRSEAESAGQPRVSLSGLRPFVCIAALGLLTARSAWAEPEPDASSFEGADLPKQDEPLTTKAGYAQIFATAMGGVGLRFNNPYRLSTPLGADAESV